ncbi:MAG TPA: CBS domain-containing protein [Trebonia sp.]|nr:CBS domain-containing protein [Trebonia sp.]
MNATVKDVMTRRVVAVSADVTYKDLAAELRENHVSALPVLDGEGRVIGVVSESDLLAKQALDGQDVSVINGILHRREQNKASAVTAAALMTTPAITIGADDTVAQAARLMYTRRVKRLPVVAPDGRIVGIVSRSDALSVYSRPDEDIRREITREVILGAILTDPARFVVEVKDGIVTISGTPETADVGHDMVRSMRHVEGVVAVRDRLSYPPVERPSSPGPLF